jgi:hypothetical protein
MAWYWPSLDTPQSAKTAAVNAVGVSALYAVWLCLSPLIFSVAQSSLPPRRLLVPLTIAAIFAMVGWGIRRMSRTAAIVGVVWWSVWLGFRSPNPISDPRGDLLSRVFGIVLGLLFLLFYVIAVRATFAYHRHLRVVKQERAPVC